MAKALLLQPVRLAGRTVYEAADTRSLSQMGNSVVASFEKSILQLAGLLGEDDRPLEGVPVSQTYRVDPEIGELVIEQRLPIQDGAEIDELLDESASIEESRVPAR